MTTFFGRAWPSSGHKLFTINNSEEKTRPKHVVIVKLINYGP